MIQLNGYVKIHRKLIQWGWYSDSVVKDVFLHLLIVAAYKDGEFLGHKIKAGQAVISFGEMATALGFSVQQVRTAIKKLESTGEISKKSTNKFTILTIENWADYQIFEEPSTNKQQTNNKPSTNKQQTNNKPSTTSKESKEIKKVKKERIKEIYKEIPAELHEPIDAFVEMRKGIKRPLTDRALGMVLKKVNELSDGDTQKAIMVLNQSTMNCWQGVFPLKEDKQVKSTGNIFLDMIEEENG